MWLIKVKYEDGHEEVIGPFQYKTDAQTFMIDHLHEVPEAKIFAAKAPNPSAFH